MISSGLFSSTTIDAAVIVGSGLSGAFDDGELETVGEIASTVVGHYGRLALWRPGGRRVLVALGRRHLYEGITPADAASTVELAASHGAAHVVITNAAGGLNPGLSVGDIMLIDGLSALLLGSRSPLLHGSLRIDADVASPSPPAFDRAWLRTVTAAALDRGLRLEQGTYAAVLGPSYETRAEIRMLRLMGADAVGMSTAPEIVAARRLGRRVTAFSLITNTLSDTARQALDHADVVVAGARAKRAMRLAIEAALAADQG
ncbi:MAG TPA: purine-nucleoside phosphorylase [Candidatus Kapabacteria bacterium]|jgi:purine-nucleoside phosphorylase|nr:purine-nucleoside phosphorylase [Candidatus Kapabacteria bacterium]